MKRQEFVFAIGFQGDTAIVDKRAMRQYARLSTMELAEKGLFRAAFCSAVYSSDEDEMRAFIEYFGDRTTHGGTETVRMDSVDKLKRLFGVYTVPDEIKRVVSL
jgi:hypothetical protein